MYTVIWKFHVRGPVECFDVVGAIYNETEGIITGGMGIEELIEKGMILPSPRVSIRRRGIKVYGLVYVYSNMGRYKTARLAASLETIDEVGPYDAEFKTKDIIPV